MYARHFDKAPEKLISKGKAAFGTYDDVSPLLDIRGMRAPYAGIPLPKFISRLRIKSRLVYVFNIENYIGFSELYDFKAFGLSQIIFWNKKTGVKYAYHNYMGNPRRYVPLTTQKGRCACYTPKRIIKVVWGRNHKHNALSFKVRGDGIRPYAEGFCISTLDDKIHTDAMFVNPSPTSSRVSVTWFNAISIKGKIELNNQTEQFSEGLAAMVINRAYYKFRSKTTFAIGLGTLPNGKKIIFHLKSSNQDAANSDIYNDNILTVDGENSALPSVYITHPFGIKKTWIIQDVENMIDLSFSPISIDERNLNIIALRRIQSSIYGTFEGTLLTKNGEKISFKSLPGIINSSLLRL